MIRTIVKAPEQFCIYDSESVVGTYNLLEYVNRLVLTEDKLVTLDLSNVEVITAAASVLLFATVNTCQLTTGNPNVIRCIFPKAEQNDRGHRYIVKTGLARALHAGTVLKLQDLTESKLYFQSSIDPNSILIPTLSLLTDKTKLTEEQLLLLHTGIGEAMLNVQHHAYRDPVDDEFIHKTKVNIVKHIGERWWQCAWYDTSIRAWIFIICDIGLGIPKTYNYIQQNQLYFKNPELALIDAFTQGNSRFIGSGRGNGSEDMKRPIEKGANESLLVYSSGIKYEFCTGMVSPKVNKLQKFFHGTLVQWTLYSS